MNKAIKRISTICMAFMLVLAMMPLTVQYAFAESEADVTVDGCGFHLWYSDAGASVAVRSYSGSATEVKLPASVTYNGITYEANDSNWFFIEQSAFNGNASITKLAIPSGYGAVNSSAFSGCTGLTEVSIGSFIEPQYGGLSGDTFKGCTNLTTYNIDSSVLDDAYSKDPGSVDSLKGQIINAGIGIDADGNPIAGVSVYTQENSVVWQAITELNESRPDDKKINLIASDDPYSRNTITTEAPKEEFTVTFVDGQGNTLKKETVEKGKDATAPEDPSREGFTFDGWDKEFSNVQENLTVTAKWKEKAADPTPTDPASTPTDPASTPTDQPSAPADQPSTPADQPSAPADQPSTPTDQPPTPTDQPPTPTDQPPTGLKGEDGTAFGKGASEDVVEAAVSAFASEEDPAGSAFGLLRARISTVKKNSVTLTFAKVSGAKKYVIYGNACGKKNNLIKQKTLKSYKSKIVFKKVSGKKVNKGTYYKFMIVAYDANGQVISTSKIVHAATKGGKFGNDKAVTTNAKKSKVTVKKGKTFKLKAKPVPQSKKLKVSRHRGIRYESSNKKIASVNSKGVIKGKKKGSCYVYAYAQNGVFVKIKVKVK